MHWRLLSANNRQLGRSLSRYADEAGARTAAAHLVDDLAAAEPLVERLPGPTRWVWSIWAGRRVLAVSGRSYEMRRSAARGLDLFLDHAAVADAPEVADTVVPQA